MVGNRLAEIALGYRQRYGEDQLSKERLAAISKERAKRAEAGLIDTVTAASGLDSILHADDIDFDKITPQMQDAFRQAYPNFSLDGRLQELSSLAPDSSEVTGFISAWKGEYFEVLVKDRLNAGEAVGDIRLNPGQIAELAPDISQPGWDLRILDPDGTVDELIQLKATESLSYVKKALERYPDSRVLATVEAASSEIESILNSDVSNTVLEEQILEPLEALLDSPLENVLESVMAGLPFLIIATMEGGGRYWLDARRSKKLSTRALSEVSKRGLL